MSANETALTLNKFADAFSEPTKLEVIEKTREFIETLMDAALDHDFSESVCCQRLRTWEETINSPISE